ncbi:zinc finger protein 711-like [Mytilus californianus]|uniref:zinc finger protein 711-like n=1 Tax=Mytilus californianus TaxID=6549 RepID=UPI0022477F61|nr:zinc finger protein 711-like [Mytilus californianus]
MALTTLSVPSMMCGVSETLYQFQQERYLCDVLIFTSDGYIPAHRVVLVAASKHFREIESSRNIHTTPEANFYLTKEKSEDMLKIVQLIYTGELSISGDNMKRIHNLCLTLALDDAVKECETFIIENRDHICIEQNKDEHDTQESKTAESDLSLKQLEAAVIDQLEQSRSNNNNVAMDTKVDAANEKEKDSTSISDASTNCHIDIAMVTNDINIDKKSKSKGQKSKNKKAEVSENNSQEQKIEETSINEKMINCALCKEKFQDKKQLLEHRRKKHQNKRKPMHTKRYIPSTNDSLTDNEDQDQLEETISNDTLSEKTDDDEVLSTRQGTKRRAADRLTKQKKAGKFVCRLCKDEFSKNELLQEHRKLIHPGGKRENLTCTLCDKVLSTWLNLIEHKYKKHNIGYDVEKYQVLMCDMPNCDFSTIVEYKMRTHYSDVHGEVGSYVCDLCNKGCKSAPQLKYHMKTVHPDDKTQMHYKCTECSKTFRHSCNLKKHIDYVHLKISDKKYLCHLCTYKCMSKTDLNNHLLKIHDIPLPKSCKVYKCEKCDYFTLTRSCYDRHQQLHQEDGLQKSFMCSTCGKGFYNIQNVKAHEKRHKSEIIVCPFEGCGYSTKFKHTMKNHIAGMHTHKNLRPYQCHLCEYSCKLKGNLDKHLRGKHGVEVMTIPKLRQKAIETGKGFSDIVFPPRNCNELPAKIADKHHLQITQKSQELQDVSFPELLEMAKQASREAQLEKSRNGEMIDLSSAGNQSSHKDNELSYQTSQNPAIIVEMQQYQEPVTPIAMETEGSSYQQEQEVALSNLNPVPITLHANKHSKDILFSNPNDLLTSYAEQNSLYLNDHADYSSRPLPAHLSQFNSAESYAAMLSSFLSNSKNGGQQSLPSLLPLTVQNYQSHGQNRPILNHLLTHMDEAGCSTNQRPTSVPAEESINFTAQLRPHSVHSVDNVSYRNTAYQGQGHYDTNLSPSDNSVPYQQDIRYSSSLQHHSPDIIIEGATRHSGSRSQNNGHSPELNSSPDKLSDRENHNRNQENYQDIGQLSYNQS